MVSNEFHKVRSDYITKYSYSPYYSLNDQLDMGKMNYYTSMNMVFGINASGFDWFNNPYIKAIIYEREVVM